MNLRSNGSTARTVKGIPMSNASDDSAQKASQARKTYNQIILDVTDEYLDELQNSPTKISPDEVERELMARTVLELKLENQSRPEKDTHLSIPQQLNFAQLAQILIRRHHVVRIAPSDKNTDRDYDLLAVYAESGPDEGIYLTSEDHIRSVARLYNRSLTINASKEVMAVLREDSPRVTRNTDKDLIAVNNGIFDYRTKRLMPFNPRLVFVSKSRVNFDPDATNPVIVHPVDGTSWDVESWMDELSDDPGVPHLLWQIIGAIIRPHVAWDKSAWFYSVRGNNGKGTLCELMRNVVGTSSYASIPLADFGKEFALEPLTHASAIIVDENDVGTYIDKAANLKAVVTNDVISMNRKHKAPIAFQFFGFMVQCLNEFPRVKDKSNSFHRRQLFVPFNKNFEGRERKYIKHDYLQRSAVLEYVLKKVLVDLEDYYVLDEPAVTQSVLNEYKEYSDPVRRFWTEFENEFTWDLLPFNFLYDLYKSWYQKESPSGSVLGRTQFIQDLMDVIRTDSDWYCQDKSAKIRPSNRMSAPELLIAQYDLKDWYSEIYNGSDINKKCITTPKAHYRGLLRTSA